MRRPRKKGLRPSTQPRPTSALLDGTFRWLKLDDHARSFRAMRAFAVVAATTRIGDHARGERLRGSILYVRCDSSSWSQHLHMLKETILERLRKTPGGDGINDLRFNVGPLDEVVGWELAAPTEIEAPAVPHALPEEIARAFGDVDDPELRAHLARLYGKLGARKR
jgi:DNA-binding transcriptional ArsR family regulator